MFPKVAQKEIIAVFTSSDHFLNCPKSLQSFKASFLNKFVAKNYQKSPDMVTLQTRQATAASVLLEFIKIHFIKFIISRRDASS